jgi:hypothetical protein
MGTLKRNCNCGFGTGDNLLLLVVPYVAASTTTTITVVQYSAGTINQVSTTLTGLVITVNGSAVGSTFPVSINDEVKFTYNPAASDGLIILQGTH